MTMRTFLELVRTPAPVAEFPGSMCAPLGNGGGGMDVKSHTLECVGKAPLSRGVCGTQNSLPCPLDCSMRCCGTFCDPPPQAGSARSIAATSHAPDP